MRSGADHPAAGMRPCVDLLDGIPAIHQPAVERDTDGVSIENLGSWVELLASDELRGRGAGTPESRRVAELIGREFLHSGLQPLDGAIGSCQVFPFQGGTDQNVIGEIPGAGGVGGPILISAHYDGFGIVVGDRLFPGADDNASGVAALVEVARLVARSGGERRTPVVFAAFGAEERGLAGVTAYVDDRADEVNRLRLAIGLDMVGRRAAVDSTQMTVLARQSGDDALIDRISKVAARVGVTVADGAESEELASFRSDVDAFPPTTRTLLLTTGLHDDYHRQTDTADKVDLEQVAAVVELVLALLDDLEEGS